MSVSIISLHKLAEVCGCGGIVDVTRVTFTDWLIVTMQHEKVKELTEKVYL